MAKRFSKTQAGILIMETMKSSLVGFADMDVLSLDCRDRRRRPGRHLLPSDFVQVTPVVLHGMPDPLPISADKA